MPRFPRLERIDRDGYYLPSTFLVFLEYTCKTYPFAGNPAIVYLTYVRLRYFRWTQLRQNGQDLPSAVARLLEKRGMVQAALNVCSRAPGIHESSIDAAGIQSGCTGGDAFLDGTRLASQLFQLVTGAPDPWNFNTRIMYSDLEKRAQCTTATGGSRNIPIVGIDYQASVLEIFDSFLALDPARHSPMDMPTSDARKSMTQMLNIANHVWFAALGFKLSRDGTSKRTAGKKRDFAYTVQFHGLIEWTPSEKPAKPVLPAWNATPPELDEKDILLTKMVRGERHIRVSESFLPSKKAKHNKIAGLQDEDMTGRDDIAEHGYCPVLHQDLIVQNTKRRRLMLPNKQRIGEREDQACDKEQDVTLARGWADEYREDVWKSSQARTRKKKKKAKTRTKLAVPPSEWMLAQKALLSQTRSLTPNADGWNVSRYWSCC